MMRGVVSVKQQLKCEHALEISDETNNISNKCEINRYGYYQITIRKLAKLSVTEFQSYTKIAKRVRGVELVAENVVQNTQM